ncbi:UNVERIFIED_CONTAM: Mcfd2 [Trichonephila clavipes]
MISVSFITTCLLKLAVGGTNHSHHVPSLMTNKSHLDDRDHIEHHMNDLTGKDVNQMAEDELQFLYFKMHDSDNNDKLDGCELVKSLLHWHIEEHDSMLPNSSEGITKIFGHDELAIMIDPILSSDDVNFDGFIDYPEFVAAQKSRGF